MAMHKIHYSRILTQRFTRQLLLFLTCAVVFACQAQPLPRLLAIESQNGVGFLLPETHFGLKVEFDAYYSNVILPAAKASNLVVPEGVQLGAAMHDPNSRSDCAGLDPKKARRKESEALVNKFLFDHPGRLVIGGFAQTHKESERQTFVDLIAMYPFILKLDEINVQAKERVFPLPGWQDPSVLSKLDRYIMSRDGRREPLEDFGDFKRSFCLVPEDRQHEFVKALIALHAVREDYDKVDLSKGELCFRSGMRQIKNQLMCMGAVAARGGSATSATCAPPERFPTAECQLYPRVHEAYYEWLLVARSKAFVKRIEESMQADTPFVIVGQAHVPDSEQGPGLITLLTEKGYKLSLIENRKQLEALLARVKDKRQRQKTLKQ
jgi:hypothetical protein